LLNHPWPLLQKEGSSEGSLEGSFKSAWRGDWRGIGERGGEFSALKSPPFEGGAGGG